MVALLLATVLAQTGPVDLSLTVDGVERKALVFRSNVTNRPSPVVFVWHGFTGGARQAAFGYGVHKAWPEATVVYPQGLEVQLLGTKAPGWQIAPKLQGDRDVKFYDALLAKMKKDYQADPRRIYTCGMSNGAIFSYVLLSVRGDTLAAAAPVAGYAARAFRGAPAVPILITHGTKDPMIPFQAAVRSRDMAISNNGAGRTETPLKPGFVSYTPVKKGYEVVWHVHDGGHEWPKGTTQAIVKFFKDHSR